MVAMNVEVVFGMLSKSDSAFASVSGCGMLPDDACGNLKWRCWWQLMWKCENLKCWWMRLAQQQSSFACAGDAASRTDNSRDNSRDNHKLKSMRASLPPSHSTWVSLPLAQIRLYVCMLISSSPPDHLSQDGCGWGTVGVAHALHWKWKLSHGGRRHGNAKCCHNVERHNNPICFVGDEMRVTS